MACLRLLSSAVVRPTRRFTRPLRLLTKAEEQERDKLIGEKERVIGQKERVIAEKERQITLPNHLEGERVITEKERQITLLTTSLERVEQESAEKVSSYVAVMANRVVTDSGLRAIYPNLPTFTARCDRFLEEDVLVGGRLSPAAVDILEKIPRQFVVERSDLVKELKAFGHHSSKGLRYLGFELAHGLYCGGEPLVLSCYGSRDLPSSEERVCFGRSFNGGCGRKDGVLNVT